jgi:amino-acid N-acetyltransferase
MSVPAQRLPMLAEVERSHLETRRARRGLRLAPRHAERAPARLRRARPADAVRIQALLERHVAAGVMLPRSLAQITRMVRDFVVVEIEGMLVGCGALRIHSAQAAEIGALAVADAMQGAGLGQRIVAALLEDARALRIRRVFALTLEVGFFHRLGFTTVDVRAFPEKFAADCAGCAKRAHCPEIAVARWL